MKWWARLLPTALRDHLTRATAVRKVPHNGDTPSAYRHHYIDSSSDRNDAPKGVLYCCSVSVIVLSCVSSTLNKTSLLRWTVARQTSLCSIIYDRIFTCKMHAEDTSSTKLDSSVHGGTRHYNGTNHEALCTMATMHGNYYI